MALKSRYGIWGALLAPPAGKNDIYSYQTRSLGSKYTKHAVAAEPRTHRHFWCILFRAHKTCLVAANVVLFLLKYFKNEANVVVFQCTVRYRVGRSSLLNSTRLFFYILFRGVGGGVL